MCLKLRRLPQSFCGEGLRCASACVCEKEGKEEKTELRRGGVVISPVPVKVMPAMNHDSQRCQQEMEKLYLKSGKKKKSLSRKAEESEIAEGSQGGSCRMRQPQAVRAGMVVSQGCG